MALWPLWPYGLENGAIPKTSHSSTVVVRVVCIKALQGATRRLSLAAQNLLKFHETRDRDNPQDIGQYNLYNHVYNLLSTSINQRVFFEETHR